MHILASSMSILCQKVINQTHSNIVAHFVQLKIAGKRKLIEIRGKGEKVSLIHH